jgi:hypothetical protein
LALVASVTLLIFHARAQSERQNTRLSFHWSGLVGISAGETASINFVNLERNEASVRLVFFDEEGRILKSVRQRVGAGRSAVLILPYSELGGRSGRAHLRTMVRIVDSDAGRPEPGGLSTLEVFDDATGRTSFGLLLPANIRGFDPQPEPPSPQ